MHPPLQSYRAPQHSRNEKPDRRTGCVLLTEDDAHKLRCTEELDVCVKFDDSKSAGKGGKFVFAAVDQVEKDGATNIPAHTSQPASTRQINTTNAHTRYSLTLSCHCDPCAGTNNSILAKARCMRAPVPICVRDLPCRITYVRKVDFKVASVRCCHKFTQLRAEYRVKGGEIVQVGLFPQQVLVPATHKYNSATTTTTTTTTTNKSQSSVNAVMLHYDCHHQVQSQRVDKQLRATATNESDNVQTGRERRWDRLAVKYGLHQDPANTF